MLEGHEEIQIDTTTVASVSPSNSTAAGGSGGLSDPTMDVWQASEDFAPQYNINDGGMSLPPIRSLSASQLNDAKAQQR